MVHYVDFILYILLEELDMKDVLFSILIGHILIIHSLKKLKKENNCTVYACRARAFRWLMKLATTFLILADRRLLEVAMRQYRPLAYVDINI